MRTFIRTLVGLALICRATGPASAASPFTVSDARSLSTARLATELLGARLAHRVIEVRRHEDGDGSSNGVPRYAEFFTQPELSTPVSNGICRTDVVVVEYDWFDHDAASVSTPLSIARVVARSRYKSFREPAGEPGSDEQTRLQKAACAGMNTAIDAFRAPTGGDAQWLAAIHAEYSDPASRFDLSCSKSGTASCAKARTSLRALALNLASDVQLIDCPKGKTGDQVRYCYRLTFPYPTEDYHLDISDYSDNPNAEWIMTVDAAMREGTAPVRIRSVHLEHEPPAMPVP